MDYFEIDHQIALECYHVLFLHLWVWLWLSFHDFWMIEITKITSTIYLHMWIQLVYCHRKVHWLKTFQIGFIEKLSFALFKFNPGPRHPGCIVSSILRILNHWFIEPTPIPQPSSTKHSKTLHEDPFQLNLSSSRPFMS